MTLPVRVIGLVTAPRAAMAEAARLTLGPVVGRLLAEMVHGEPPCVDPTPYAPERFG
jgi:glycine/D-amino acid oxidase-like deaminating enzyme